MAHVAAVKYALVSASNPTLYMWCVFWWTLSYKLFLFLSFKSISNYFENFFNSSLNSIIFFNPSGVLCLFKVINFTTLHHIS